MSKRLKRRQEFAASQNERKQEPERDNPQKPVQPDAMIRRDAVLGIGHPSKLATQAPIVTSLLAGEKPLRSDVNDPGGDVNAAGNDVNDPG